MTKFSINTILCMRMEMSYFFPMWISSLSSQLSFVLDRTPSPRLDRHGRFNLFLVLRRKLRSSTSRQVWVFQRREWGWARSHKDKRQFPKAPKPLDLLNLRHLWTNPSLWDGLWLLTWGQSCSPEALATTAEADMGESPNCLDSKRTLWDYWELG